MTVQRALLYLCFFLSGLAALLYQTAWIRELGFLFGTSELAVAVVLSAYMGGLALGAALAARFAARVTRPVLAYGLLELAIAVCALAIPFELQGLNFLYGSLMGGQPDLSATTLLGTTAFQLFAAFAILVPPTALMGATLPLLTRHVVRRESEIGSGVGSLYAVNTAGAIFGTLLAGFWLMPEIGLRRTVQVGACVNAAVFLAAWGLARASTLQPVSAKPAAARFGWVLPAIALSGCVSFVYEVLWTRLLVHVLGSSVYAFSSMLASFLLGITVGSAFAARLASTPARASIGFAFAQLGIAIAGWATFAAADQLPGVAQWLGAGPEAPAAARLVAILVLLPLSLTIGATFPFAVRILAADPEQAASASARVYAWNTIGSIVGSLSAGFVLLPVLGFAGTVIAAVAVNLSLALAWALGMRPRGTRLAWAAVACAVFALVAPPRTPWLLLRNSPMLRTPIAGPIEFLGVGRSTTVLLIEKGCRLRLASGGLPESMIATRACHPTVYIGNWLSLLPGLVHPDAREALVVGLGGSLVVEALPSSFERADVVELEAEVLRANRHVAGLRARDPLADPRVRVHIREARGALRLSSKRYDVIVSQPSHPWTAGSSNLYTREFFDLVRSRLDDRGLFVQWIGIAFVDDALLRTLVATLFDVFPHVQIYQPNPQALLFVASADPIDGLAGARVALARFPEAYERYGIAHVEDLAARLLLDEQDAREFARGAAVNTDDLNLLSTRAPDLGSAALEPKALDALVAPYDTLLEEVPDLDRGFVLRRMLSIGLTGRAARLVEKLPPLEADIGAGWIALNARRPRTATLAFERALERDPDSGQALVGLVLSQKVAIARGSVPARIEAAALSPETRAVIEGWQREKRGDVLAVRDLEPQLERIGEDQPLYESATRLRIRWRLASSDLERAAEALRLATRLVVPFEAPEDVLLRAEAAEAAGEIDTAWASLEQLDAQLARARPAKLMSRAQELAQRLPDSPAERGLRARLAGRAR